MYRLHCLVELASLVGAANLTDAFLEHRRVEVGVLYAMETVRQPYGGGLCSPFDKGVVVEIEYLHGCIGTVGQPTHKLNV